MASKKISASIKTIGVKAALKYLEKDPEDNIPKLINWLEKLDKNNSVKRQLNTVKKALSDKNSPWHKLVLSIYSDIDPDVRKKLFENFIINANIIGLERERQLRKEENCNIPWAILLDPTSACNLHCVGCWAAEYGNKLNLSPQEWDSIIDQGRKMGTFMFIYSGGEPLMRKKEIIDVCEKYNDCVFLAFTNATLIDEDFAKDMLRVKNFIPAISIEGFEEDTDYRRGAGTYKKVIGAMEILKKNKLPFGISCCYTSKNTAIIGSEEYIDDMIEKGAKFAWFFTYMPVGIKAVPELMVSAEQRKFMYERIREYRKTKPIFTLDFWNDGEYVNGCIAGGRRYLHINANGDIEPCAFIHYSDSNIRDKSLLDAYKSPLFTAYKEGQPFNANHLRPCPLLDNPSCLAKMVKNSGAYSTDLEHREDVDDLTGKCWQTAEKWQITADKLWAASHGAKTEKK